MSIKNILITGGAGSIGSNLVHKLHRKKYKIFVVDNLSSGFKNKLPRNIKFIKGSIYNSSILNKIFRYKYDTVIHLAAFFANQNSVDHPEKDLKTNGIGTLKLLEKSKKNNVKKFIYISSSCVYGNQKTMIESNYKYKPDTPYAITKLLGEYYCNFYSKKFKMDISIARIFNCYGPGEMPGKYRNVIPNFIKCAINNQDIVITGDGNEVRDFTYVDDIINGIYLLLNNQKNKSDNTFNFGSGRQTNIFSLAKKIIKFTNSKSKIKFVKKRDWDLVKKRLANIDKAKDILNYQPKTNIDEGLKKTIKWLKLQKI